MKERVQNHIATTVALVVSLIAAGFLVASPSPSAAAAAVVASAECEAEVGGPHCCACGDSGSGHFCVEISQNAYARCNSVDVCEGSCWGSVE